MKLDTLGYINLIVTFLVIVPLILSCFYIKKSKKIKLIFYYLLISFCTELISVGSYFILKNTIRIAGTTFVVLEALFMIFFFWEYFDKYFKLFLKVCSSIFLLIYLSFILDIYVNSNEIMYGGNKFILILITLYMLIHSIKHHIEKWLLFFSIAIFQYSLISASIHSFVGFFIKNREYMDVYIIINASANFLLYLFICICIQLWRKQYLQA